MNCRPRGLCGMFPPCCRSAHAAVARALCRPSGPSPYEASSGNPVPTRCPPAPAHAMRLCCQQADGGCEREGGSHRSLGRGRGPQPVLNGSPCCGPEADPKAGRQACPGWGPQVMQLSGDRPLVETGRGGTPPRNEPLSPSHTPVPCLLPLLSPRFPEGPSWHEWNHQPPALADVGRTRAT